MRVLFPIGEHTPLMHGFLQVPGPYFMPDTHLLTTQKTIPFAGISTSHLLHCQLQDLQTQTYGMG